ncbi:carbon-nitrogen hydrolase family protein [Parvularcula sp. LCG005]|uniref:carbon-nitrogen hydrolase family protein n=1 Tax=Parvularcula sp. LCG005 TaxID=3078805 RepID=UPI002942BE11|nr:carbon-nitrogen hydrolase family protein [Parvularcula sp. LCG005]WOI52452.1 carbon-nitrogen hydrolase family protein [Parvularcula sp. LCG005]
MRVGLVQMNSGIDRMRNLDEATRLIREAAARGADLIATPEMTTLLDRNSDRLFGNLPAPDAMPEVDAFSALARDLGAHLLIGSMPVAVERGETRKFANRSFLFGPRGAVATYDKIHLFDVDLPTGESWKESNTVAGGDKAVLANTPLGGIGMSVCYDLRFPHHFRRLAQAGASILAVPAAFTVPTGEAHWHVLLRARAIETGSYVIAPAQGGQHEDGRATYGHSLIVDPWGTILAEQPNNQPGVIVADIDLDKVADVRRRVPNLTLDRDVETRIYEL